MILTLQLESLSYWFLYGERSGVLGTAVRDASGVLYLYHPDKNYPSCSSGWVRHEVGPNLVIINPDGEDGCLSFDGLVEAPTWVSDIALDSSGTFRMLIGHNPDITVVQEWTSADGLSFSLSGNEWYAPGHPTSGWAYSVWDAAFLKNDQRLIEEPKIVVAQISDGETFEDIVDASLGRWSLYYWAEEGANVPENFGGEAHSCNTFQGFVDSLTCESLIGWAWDNSYPNVPTSVELYVDEVLSLTVPADTFRQDLFDNGIGDGFHAFGVSIPTGTFGVSSQNIEVKYLHTEWLVPGGQFVLACDEIFSDGFETGDLSRWSE